MKRLLIILFVLLMSGSIFPETQDYLLSVGYRPGDQAFDFMVEAILPEEFNMEISTGNFVRTGVFMGLVGNFGDAGSITRYPHLEGPIGLTYGGLITKKVVCRSGGYIGYSMELMDDIFFGFGLSYDQSEKYLKFSFEHCTPNQRPGEGANYYRKHRYSNLGLIAKVAHYKESIGSYILFDSGAMCLSAGLSFKISLAK